MTTEYKITRADITADASQNRELMQGIEQTLDRMNAPANDAHTPDWYLAPGSLKNEHFLIVAGHSVAKVRTSNQRVLELIAAAPETAAERDRLKKQLNQACDTLDFATSELEKARGQVKTLEQRIKELEVQLG